jgi:hypothetical protein
LVTGVPFGPVIRYESFVDWLTFTTAMTKALVWPAVVMFAVLLFRGQATMLLTRLGKRKVTAKGGGVEVTISEELDKVEDVQGPVLTSSPVGIVATGTGQIMALEGHTVAQSSATGDLTAVPPLPPAYIISQAWLRVIDALKSAQASRLSKSGGPPITGASALRFAQDEGILSPEDAEVLYELRRIRNDAVHNAEADVSLTDALRYRDLANRIVAAIDQSTQRGCSDGSS